LRHDVNEGTRVRDLDSKVAVITGAASGIGRAMVDQFLAEGMRVVLADVEQAALDGAVAELESYADRIVAVTADVSKAEDVEALATTAIERFGGVHVLCSNAGVSTFGRSWKFSLADWEWVLGVNIWGVIHGMRSFVPRFVEQGEGHIVNTSSMVGVNTATGLAPYSVSKHGVVALSEALALELQEIESGVGVSVLCPGFVRTNIGASERNKPGAKPQTKGIGKGVTDLLDQGLQPAEVAAMVSNAIKNEEFWIFTDPDMLAGVEQRMSAILESRPPSAFDFETAIRARG
jgi:NAD(P)-dependent dehydrogenase (short-subunit alcohol dehydrogenase family)